MGTMAAGKLRWPTINQLQIKGQSTLNQQPNWWKIGSSGTQAPKPKNQPKVNHKSTINVCGGQGRVSYNSTPNPKVEALMLKAQVNQEINQKSTKQSIDRYRSKDLSIDVPIDLSIYWFIYLSIDLSIGLSIHRSIDWSTHQSIYRSIHQSIDRSLSI